MMKPLLGLTAAFLGASGLSTPAAAREALCDRTCLESIGAQYRTAYLAHDPKRAPFDSKVRFSENNVMMSFPDGTWDTVTQELGEPLYLSDPKTGSVGIYTAILQNDTPGFLAIRLKVENRKITEIEHIISTKRNLSAPPTPFGDPTVFRHDPDLDRAVSKQECGSREQMRQLANGYFSTLENNNGEIRGTRFSPDAKRFENGMEFPEIEKGFKLGRYRFNERVRDRDFFLIDEHRCIVMARAFIDHKGVLDKYILTDGKPAKSIFREPHSWSLLEMFKIKNGMITGVEAVFTGAPYYIRSPWSQ